MSISFFSPIYVANDSHPLEKCGFLRGTTQFFDFGQRAYTILPNQNGIIELSGIDGDQPSWIGIALRVAALLTVIIPLIMCLGVLIYRSLNQFQVCNKQIEAKQINIDQLPKEILEIILKESGPACLQFGNTCKAHLKIIEDDISFKRHRVTPLLEEASLLAKTLWDVHDKSSILLEVAKVFALHDPAIALDMVAKVLEENQNVNEYLLAEVLFSLISKDPKMIDATIEVANTLNNNIKFQTLACVAKALAASNLEGAKKIANHAIEEASILESNHIRGSNQWFDIPDSLVKIFSEIAAFYPEKVMEEADKVITETRGKENRAENRAYNFNTIAKIVAPLNLQKAKDLANGLEGIDKSSILLGIAEALAESNPKGALELIKTIENHNQNMWLKTQSLSTILKSLAKVDLQKALDEAALILIEDPYSYSTAIRCIVEVVAPSDLKRALEIAGTDQMAHQMALSCIVTAITSSNPQKALEVADNLDYKIHHLAFIAKAFASLDPVKAEEVSDRAIAEANTLEDIDPEEDIIPDDKSRIFSEIVAVIAEFNLSKAMKVAHTIKSDYYKARALASIALAYLKNVK